MKKGPQPYWTGAEYTCLPSVEEDDPGTPGFHAFREISYF